MSFLLSKKLTSRSTSVRPRRQVLTKKTAPISKLSSSLSKRFHITKIAKTENEPVAIASPFADYMGNDHPMWEKPVLPATTFDEELAFLEAYRQLAPGADVVPILPAVIQAYLDFYLPIALNGLRPIEGQLQDEQVAIVRLAIANEFASRLRLRAYEHGAQPLFHSRAEEVLPVQSKVEIASPTRIHLQGPVVTLGDYGAVAPLYGFNTEFLDQIAQKAYNGTLTDADVSQMRQTAPTHELMLRMVKFNVLLDFKEKILNEFTNRGLELPELEPLEFPYGPVYLTGEFGTPANPVLVPSNSDYRYVGCTGGSGPQGHELLWHNVKKEKPLVCLTCSQVYRLCSFSEWFEWAAIQAAQGRSTQTLFTEDND